MKRSMVAILAAGTATILAAHAIAQGGADQVIARVGGETITRAQLFSELPPGVTDPVIQSVGLQALVSRKLLVQEARKQQLDKTPVGAMLLKRADELAMAALLEQQMGGTPPVISDQQARAFVAANPLMFAGRRLITLDQFVIDEGGSGLAARFQPANSMAEFEDILLHDRLTYQRTSQILDTLNIDAKGGAKLAVLRPGQVFISPRGTNGLELSGVTENRAVPIGQQQAESMARLLLTKRALEQKVRSQVDELVKAHQADVQLNPDYAPKPK